MSMTRKLLCAVAIVLVASLALDSGQERHVVGDEKRAEDALKESQIEYAQAVLKSAKVNLAWAQDTVAKAPGSFPRSTLHFMENYVAIAESRLKLLRGGKESAGETPYLTAAKNDLAYAEGALKRSQEIYARSPNADSSKWEIPRLQAEVDLARPRLRIAQLLESAPPQERMQWEITQLQVEVYELQCRVRALQFRD